MERKENYETKDEELKPEVIEIFDCSESEEDYDNACAPGNCSPMDPPCMVPGN